jgi:hypothetical protein
MKRHPRKTKSNIFGANEWGGNMVPGALIINRGGVSSTRGLVPTMTARDQSIGISIGMLPQTLIMSRLDQLSRLGAGIYFFHCP